MDFSNITQTESTSFVITAMACSNKFFKGQGLRRKIVIKIFIEINRERMYNMEYGLKEYSLMVSLP